MWKNLLEAIDAVGRAERTDPRLSPRLDASNVAKRKCKFLPELCFGAQVCTMPLSENTMFLLSVILQVSLCWGKMLLPIDSFQINADYHKIPSSENALFSVCQSLPAFPCRGLRDD